MSGSAVGAMDPFHKNDLARWVVFRQVFPSANWNTAVASEPFRIRDDVQRNESKPLPQKYPRVIAVFAPSPLRSSEFSRPPSSSELSAWDDSIKNEHLPYAQLVLRHAEWKAGRRDYNVEITPRGTKNVPIIETKGGGDLSTTICAGSEIPLGWIIVNKSRDVGVCNGATSIGDNVLTIERYDNKPVGASMSVCFSSSVPQGWVRVNSSRDIGRCGGPPIVGDTVMQIRRAQ